MFDDLHDPDPPKPGMASLAAVTTRAQQIRRRRMMSVGGGALACVVLVALAVVVPRLGDDDRRISTVDNSVVPTSTPPTSAPPTTSIATGVSVETTIPGVSPSGVLPFDRCRSVEQPPVYLVDGTPPGGPAQTKNEDDTTDVRWGSDDSTQVTQHLGVESVIGDVASAPNAFIAGDFSVAFFPTTDPADGPIGIQIQDAVDHCIRLYSVGPGLELHEAVAFATQWLQYLDVARNLTAGESVDDPSGDQACTSMRGEDSSDAVLGCVDVPQEFSQALVRGRLDLVATSVGVLQLLVPRGADAVPLSSLARRVPLTSNPALELIVDLVPRGESCGRVTAGDLSTNWAFRGAGESTCDGASPTVEPSLPVAAIDGNGDAVVIESLDGTSTVLYDGVDPDDPAPTEGDTTAVDGVALAPGGTSAMVGICCEPVAGSLVQVDVASGEQQPVGFGHLPAFASGGDLVAASYGSINVGDPGGVPAVTYEIDPSTGLVLDLAVIDQGDFGGMVLYIVTGPDGTTLVRRFVAGGDMVLSTTISPATWTDHVQLSLAGWKDNTLYVLDASSGSVLAFDGETLAQLPSDRGPVDWISAWIEGDAVKYIDAQRRLFVDGVHVPGEYIWVR